MRSIVILFLLIGICLVVVGYVQSNQQCPPPVVEFKYVPQSFEQEQNLPTPLLSIFGTMFNEDSAWEQTQGYADKYTARQLNSVNKN
jgi:hypothetical protein